MTSPFESLRARIRESRRRNAAYRRVYGELSAMTPRELADLGIAPGSLHDIASDAARNV